MQHFHNFTFSDEINASATIQPTPKHSIVSQQFSVGILQRIYIGENANLRPSSAEKICEVTSMDVFQPSVFAKT